MDGASAARARLCWEGSGGPAVVLPDRSFLVCYWALTSVPITGLESRRAKESAK
jgi:hypothetical protein